MIPVVHSEVNGVQHGGFNKRVASTNGGRVQEVSVMAGGNVLVEISDNSHRGDGLRLLRVPDALKQRLSNATKGAMR